MTATAFEIALFTSVFLVTTVFGMMLVFAIVVMPGIARLDDGDYLRAFQVIDGVVQDKQPIFYFVWIGAVVATVITSALGWSELDKDRRFQLLMATLAYLGTQVSTMLFNIPLNNHLKELQIQYLDSTTKQTERVHFEASWCFWNWARTVVMGFVSLYLLYLLFVED
eukprot:scaffold2102_cov161-Amphora_coffeaeformis.AAC.17